MSNELPITILTDKNKFVTQYVRFSNLYKQSILNDETRNNPIDKNTVENITNKLNDFFINFPVLKNILREMCNKEFDRTNENLNKLLINFNEQIANAYMDF